MSEAKPLPSSGRTSAIAMPRPSYFWRVDEAQNVRRFYGLGMERTLFGEWCAVQSWGRIGTKGSAKITYFDAELSAHAFLLSEQQRRLRRGYELASADTSQVNHL